MKTLLRITMCWVSLLWCISSSHAASTLTSSVDRYQIGEDETLNLTIIYKDASASGQPDLAGLQKNFDILSSNTSSSTRIINGAIDSSKTWRYVLLPRNTGKLLIPSFQFQGHFSDAIEITVLSNTELDDPNQARQGDLFIEATVDKKEAYVQEMITLTLRIYTAVRIAQPKLDEMNLPGFMVEKLGESQFERRQGGRNYYVLQYQYALFPSQSGELSIPKKRYKISQIISNGPRSLFNVPGLENTQARFLSSPEIKLNIKPAEHNPLAPYWLVAEDVRITDNWNANSSIIQGEPVTRTIQIEALGTVAANIPPISEFSITGIKQYPEQPQLNNERAADSLKASRIESSAIVGIDQGSYTLPEIQIHWWNSKQRQFNSSTLPSRKLTVLPRNKLSKDNSSPVTTDGPIQDSSEQASSQLSDGEVAIEKLNQTDKIDNVPFYRNATLWMLLSALELVILLLMLFALVSARRNANSNASEHVKAHHNLSIKQSLKAIQSACDKNNPTEARAALIRWGQLAYSSHILSLQQLKQAVNRPEFNTLADSVDAALFRPSGSEWNGQALANYMKGIEGLSEAGQQQVQLPGLYKS